MKRDIQKSYQLLGNMGSVYDGMITYTKPLGKLMNKMFWGFNKETTEYWITKVLSAVDEDFDGKLLEVPVGTGVLTMPLYHTLSKADITCLDYTVEMMNNAKDKANMLGISNIEFIQGDVGHLPFEDESFDIVLSLNGFHAFPDKEAAYKETYRVLKPGGIFCGCFYIQGEKKRTDLTTKYLFVPKQSFTPPFETRETLKLRLDHMYQEVEFSTCNALGIFKCKK